ncbi:MAG: hypothetical protein IKI77_08815 [Oscillospiraceae bacterium]|nr:hypothetical protein [Oscillospiraceae bacterium]
MGEDAKNCCFGSWERSRLRALPAYSILRRKVQWAKMQKIAVSIHGSDHGCLYIEICDIAQKAAGNQGTI